MPENSTSSGTSSQPDARHSNAGHSDSRPSDDRHSDKGTRRETALSSGVFRLYFGASCFSTFAVWISRFLLGWTTWDLTGSAFWVGLVSAVMLLPTFILSPIFGVLSDRISARKGMLVTTLLQASIAACAASASFAGVFGVGWLLVIAACIGAVSAAHHPMRLSLVARLVDRNLLPSAIGLTAIVFNTSRILGPAFAAWLVALTSLTWAFAVATGLFLAALAFLLNIHSVEKAKTASGRSLLGDLADGLNFIAGHPAIRLILMLTLVNGLLGRSVIEVLPAISGQLVNGDAATLAWLTGCAGVGSIIGGIVVSRQPGNERRMLNLVLVCMLGGAAALLPVPLVTTTPQLAAVILLLSMAMTMIGTGCQALTQLTVADVYRGRVLSIWSMVSMGVPAFGAFCVGAAADIFGFGRVLLALGMLAMLLTLLLARRRHIVAH